MHARKCNPPNETVWNSTISFTERQFIYFKMFFRNCILSINRNKYWIKFWFGHWWRLWFTVPKYQKKVLHMTSVWFILNKQDIFDCLEGNKKYEKFVCPSTKTRAYYVLENVLQFKRRICKVLKTRWIYYERNWRTLNELKTWYGVWCGRASIWCTCAHKPSPL